MDRRNPLDEKGSFMKIRHIVASLVAVGTAATLSIGTFSVATAAPSAHSQVASGAMRAQASVVVPNVVGENVGVAISRLQALGFGLGFRQFTDNRCDFDPFEVTKQSPAAGTSVAPGSVVTVTFAVRPAPPKVCP